jgi:hypothetical protein
LTAVTYVVSRASLAVLWAALLISSIKVVAIVASITLSGSVADSTSSVTGGALVVTFLPEGSLCTVLFVGTGEVGLVDPLCWRSCFTGLTGLEYWVVNDVTAGKATIVTFTTNGPRLFLLGVWVSFRFDMEISLCTVLVLGSVHASVVLLVSTQRLGFASGTLICSSHTGDALTGTDTTCVVSDLPELSVRTNFSRNTSFS